jgi:2-polyprenyl-6-methoxyphenol hydroxylase-like FAD-dependent oxidoreductase
LGRYRRPFRGETITSSGHGFIGIGRKRLLAILQERARELGVVLHFEPRRARRLEDWRDYDLVIAADGANSRFRDASREAFRGRHRRARATSSSGSARRKRSTPSPSPSRRPSTAGSGPTPTASRPTARPSSSNGGETWRKLGFDRMDQDERSRSASGCSPNISTASLMSNAIAPAGRQAWLNFRRIKCERWSSGNVILLGDAAHTAHFSIGSGTKLALEDAIKLAEVLNREGGGLQRESLEAALDEYQAERNLEVLKLQNSARNSTEWFETLERYLHFEPLQFAYSLLTRSQRISHENLRLRDREWLEGVERWFQEARGTAGQQDPRRRCSRRSTSCATWSSTTASSSRRWRCIRRSTAFRTTSTSSITASARPGRRRPGLHRDDLRLARGPDQPGLHRHVERARACRRVEADRRFRPRQSKRQICLQLGHSGPRVRPSSAGKATTSRSTTATGR